MTHCTDNLPILYYCTQELSEWVKGSVTLASTDGDTEKELLTGFLVSSSDEQSEHKKCSNFFASSIDIPIQEG